VTGRRCSTVSGRSSERRPRERFTSLISLLERETFVAVRARKIFAS
jgi:hypothetical protein